MPDTHCTLRSRLPARALAPLCAVGVMGGCQGPPTFEAAPPSVMVYHGGRAQALWLGNRVLSAVHVVSDDAGIPSSIWLQGKSVAVLGGMTGDYLAPPWKGLANASRSIVGDWAALTVDASSPTDPSSVEPGDGSVRTGERLYLVGYDPNGIEPGLRVMPVRVLATGVTLVDGDEEHALPPSVIAVRALSKSEPGPGWSGSFVGRYDRRAVRWTYIGHVTGPLEGASPGDGAIRVVRPPEDVVQWFFEGAGK